jgi:hypothetical protein
MDIYKCSDALFTSSVSSVLYVNCTLVELQKKLVFGKFPIMLKYTYREKKLSRKMSKCSKLPKGRKKGREGGRERGKKEGEREKRLGGKKEGRREGAVTLQLRPSLSACLDLSGSRVQQPEA